MPSYKPFVINDLAFGDSSKGKWTSYLANKYAKDLVVRFNSGPNAHHNVIDYNIHHCFSQFGSASLADIPTLFSKHTLIEPLALENEAISLSAKVNFNPYSRLFLDSRAKLITPYHVIANRLNSESGTTTGMGIGVTVQDSLDRPNDFLTLADLCSTQLAKKLLDTKEYIIHTYGYHEAYDIDLDDLLKRYSTILKKLQIIDSNQVNSFVRKSNIIFEGSQGILLDEDKGFAPYNSWSRTTKHNALEILVEAGIDEKPVVFGLTRTYATRHGKGPCPTYNEHLTNVLPEPHNTYNDMQGKFFCGWADLELLKYAIKCNDGVDYLLISHTDYLKKLDKWQVNVSYSNCELALPKNIYEQYSLTDSLFKAVPQYEKIKAAEVVGFIGKKLNTEIFATSYSPKTDDVNLI